MKLVVSSNSYRHLGELINKDIDGIILYIDKLSVNSNYYVDVNILDEFDFKDKEIFLCMNKIMHNSDLEYLRSVINKIKDKNIKILFYDMAVYNICLDLGICDKLVIYQDHLNASVNSNNFYYDLGIKGSFITNDITYEELMEIKNNTKMKLMFLGYGYQPIFYSRRYLVSNYLKYIDQDKGDNYQIISDNLVKYPISEEEYGTTIYTPKEINLINYLSDLDSIDYIVMNSVNMDSDKFNLMVDKFIKREQVENTYLGFFKIKTIYKVKYVKSSMKRVELLAPAGNLERLKIALLYGADAVYIGGKDYSLRANAINFSIDEMDKACKYAHSMNKKVYVTINIVFHNEDSEGLLDYLYELERIGVDAIIISDPQVIKLVKDNNIKLDIHISTQYSSVNYEVVNFWKKMGVSRVVLGRETSREEIKEIIDKTGMELEIFIHGAMCASYSGRCVLSNYFTNRDANRGGCAQICRFIFDLEKDGEVIDDKIKFTMCSKDLCMLKYIPDIIDIGVGSLKVEGRMRSIYYIATVINTYRKIIDDYYNDSITDEKINNYLKVLNRVANRDNVAQFYNKFPDENEQYFGEREEVSNQDYLGIVDSYDGEYVTLIQKNYFKPGDVVEIISPSKDTFEFVIPTIYDIDMNVLECARHPEQIIKFKLDKEVSKYDMMRIKIS